LLFLKASSYFSGSKNGNNFYTFTEIYNCITLSLPELQIKKAVDLQNVSENFNAEILNRPKFYEEYT